MNILVTGGFGYIGSQVVPELARRGHTVDIAARSVPEHFASLAQQHAFREWDIREAWRGASPARYDLLVHLAEASSTLLSHNQMNGPNLSTHSDFQEKEKLHCLCKYQLLLYTLY